jgi:hypothetical protein
MTDVEWDSERDDAPKRERQGKPWAPLVSLLLGVLALALSPAFGLGVFPAAAGIVVGHRARRYRTGRVQSGFGLALSYLAMLASIGVGVMVATPIIQSLLISGGFLLP